MRRNDAVLLLIVAISALLSWFLLRNSPPDVKKITVLSAKRVVYAGPLGEKLLRVPSPHGEVTVRLDNSGAVVLDSPCPDRLCVKQGRLSRCGSIVCLPEQVAVIIEGARKEDEPDAVLR